MNNYKIFCDRCIFNEKEGHRWKFSIIEDMHSLEISYQEWDGKGKKWRESGYVTTLGKESLDAWIQVLEDTRDENVLK